MNSNVFSVFGVFRILGRGISSMKISEIYDKNICNTDASIKGWVKSMRKMRNTFFLDINDGSTFKSLQTVIKKDSVHENLTYGASVELSGKLMYAPSGQIELHPTEIKVIGPCDVTQGYPFLPRTKYKPQEMREHLHFRPRTTTFGSALRVRNRVSQCIHEFFQCQKFMCIHTPVLTSNDCEGAGEIFRVVPDSKETIDEMRKEEKKDEEAFFDRSIFLTVSGQLHLEVMARALGEVYQFGPTFRAENNKSRFHLSEFYMVEAEVAFLENIDDLMKLMEGLIKSITRSALETHEEEINNYRKSFLFENFNVSNAIDKPYIVMDFDDACLLLEKHDHQFSSPLGNTKHLTKEHELFLVNYNNNTPVFIVNWPREKKPFYVKMSKSTNKANAVDLLFPEVGELCGGSLREDNYELLKQRLIEHNLHKKLTWYLDLRQYGNVPTGGFGMGFERYLKFLLGTSSIKDTIPFPRWPHNCML